MAQKPSIPKGTRDFSPLEMMRRTYMFDTIRRVFRTYGYAPLETPAMENLSTLTGKYGEEGDKLLFKILNSGDFTRGFTPDDAKVIAAGTETGGAPLNAMAARICEKGLRYDLTVPFARYVVQHQAEITFPFRRYQVQPVWRADRPQKGRFRQFTQCDIDILGDDTNLAEIELIAATSDMLSQIFSEVGITDFTIHINDRQILRAAALQAGFEEEAIGSVLISLDKYDKIGLEGIRKELIENGYAEDVVTRYLAIYESLQGDVTCGDFCSDIAENYLDRKVVEGVDDIISCAKAMINEHVKITFDPTLVRGMGYYTGTIFEISIDGYNFSIAGGGRYDKMIGKFCGQDVSACGFSIGFERIITILKDKLETVTPVSEKNLAILIGKNVPLDRKLEIFKRAKALRAEGTTVTIQPMRKNMKQQIEKLEAEGFKEFEKVYND